VPVGRQSAHAPGPPEVLQTTTTEAREQNNTGPLGKPVITMWRGHTVKWTTLVS